MFKKRKNLFISYFGYKDTQNGRQWVFGNCFSFKFDAKELTPRILEMAETDIKSKCELDSIAIINFKVY